MGMLFAVPYFVLIFRAAVLLNSASSNDFVAKDVSFMNRVLPIHPQPSEDRLFADGLDGVMSCQRVRVVPLSRWDIHYYANSFRLSLKLLDILPVRGHDNVDICFHGNASIGLCQCAKYERLPLQNGQWSISFSPYEEKYIDIRFIDGDSCSVTVSLEEEFQKWRLFCLGAGFVMLLLAPLVSRWVPFYYSSSMAVGVLLIVLLILFQGMKLLPTSRRNVFYFAVYGSMLSASSLLLQYFSMVMHSMLEHIGLSEDMHMPVSIFVLVGIILVGAATGYLMVRKFVLSKDGSVDAGISQFVKWAVRIIAVAFISQSTPDIPLAIAAISLCLGISFLAHRRFQRQKTMQRSKQLLQRRARHACENHKRVQFRSRSAEHTVAPDSRREQNLSAWSSPPVKSLAYSPCKKSELSDSYYSVYHKNPRRRRFTRREWEEFTNQSTKAALAEWGSSPEFADWMVRNAERVRLLPTDESDASTDRESGSSAETSEDGESGLSLFGMC